MCLRDAMKSDFAHVQDDVNPHILGLFKGTFWGCSKALFGDFGDVRRHFFA